MLTQFYQFKITCLTPINVCFLDCGNPAPSNGQADTSAGTTLGAVSTLLCNSGYTLSGSTAVLCQADGWNDTATCTINGKTLVSTIDTSVVSHIPTH